MGHVIDDGQLASWQDVARIHDWRDLLLGNGLSRHVWPPFAYESLYQRACERNILTRVDRRLFESDSTVNFESVLAALAVTMRTIDTLKEPGARRLQERYLRIQQALGAAVRDVHVPLSLLPETTRQTLQRELRKHRWVFTTSYDLVLYWCAGYRDFRGFTDYFYSGGDRLEFHVENTSVRSDVTRLVYLHGALHLLVGEKGITRKRRSSGATLLEQFGVPDPKDPRSRPLLIAEGTATEKARIIADNEYLSFGLNRLRHTKHGLVVFGLSLREEDAHLVDALNHRTDRPIAVGLRAHNRSSNRRRQANIRKLLDIEELYFFDASTHPLGNTTLAHQEKGTQPPPRRFCEFRPEVLADPRDRASGPLMASKPCTTLRPLLRPVRTGRPPQP